MKTHDLIFQLRHDFSEILRFFIKSKYNVDVEYEFTIPGIYAYWCTPHKSLGMIGFVVVGGDKHNLEQIKNTKFFGKSRKISSSLIEHL